MKVIAHRGACTEALENSWSAFRKAIEAGAHRIELDVHLTADQQIAIIHDEDLVRTAGIQKSIASLNRSEIERTVLLSNQEKVPFLDEVFSELLPLIEINVEIKTPGSSIADQLARMIEKLDNPQKVIVSCFYEETCAWFAEHYPDVRLALLWDRSLWWPGAFRLGPLRFLSKHGIRIYHPDANLVTPHMVEVIKDRGWHIYPYVGLKNEEHKERLWSYLMTLGVDGLCTNYPRQLKLWLQEAEDDEERFRKKHILVHRSS